jgi:hypothetical protein
MKPIVAFLRFWYDFIVGDDWRVAVGVAAAIGFTALVPEWWTMPVAVVAILLGSLSAAARRH